jgi:ubiquinone/menaquinone biosynthesis C-methylase UbiE
MGFDKNKVKINFSKAKNYDNYISYHNTTLDMTAKDITNYLKKNYGLTDKPVNILDAGCGTGNGFIYINDIIGSKFNYFGLDIAKNILYQARKKINKTYNSIIANSCIFNVYTYNAYFTCADCEELPFKDKSFEIIFSNMVMHWLNNIPEFIGSVKNILNDNGIFVCSFLANGTLNELSSCYKEAISLHGQDKNIELHSFPEKSYVKNLLSLSGFTIEKFKIIKYLEYSDSMLSILKKINMLGAKNSLNNKKGNMGDRYIILKQVLKEYDRIYKDNNKVFATYNICYFIAKKRIN